MRPGRLLAFIRCTRCRTLQRSCRRSWVHSAVDRRVSERHGSRCGFLSGVGPSKGLRTRIRLTTRSRGNFTGYEYLLLLQKTCSRPYNTYVASIIKSNLPNHRALLHAPKTYGRLLAGGSICKTGKMVTGSCPWPMDRYITTRR
jgi:hypothetical protein